MWICGQGISRWRPWCIFSAQIVSHVCGIFSRHTHCTTATPRRGVGGQQPSLLPSATQYFCSLPNQNTITVIRTDSMLIMISSLCFLRPWHVSLPNWYFSNRAAMSIVFLVFANMQLYRLMYPVACSFSDSCIT